MEVTGELKSKMYVAMKPDSKVADIGAAAAHAESIGADALCVPQWMVSCAKEQTKLPIATIVGLPGGTTSEFQHYAETKQALANGASIVIIPMNVELIKRGELGKAKAALNYAMIALRGSSGCAFALIDGKEVPDFVPAAKAALDNGVKAVLIANADPAAVAAASTEELPLSIYGKEAAEGIAWFASSTL